MFNFEESSLQSYKELAQFLDVPEHDKKNQEEKAKILNKTYKLKYQTPYTKSIEDFSPLQVAITLKKLSHFDTLLEMQRDCTIWIPRTAAWALTYDLFEAFDYLFNKEASRILLKNDSSYGTCILERATFKNRPDLIEEILALPMYKQINKDNAVKWLNGAVTSENIATLNVLLKFEPIIAETANQSILKSAFSTSNKAIINRLLSVPKVLQYIKENYRQYQAEYSRYVKPFLVSKKNGNFNTQNNIESFDNTPIELFMGTKPTSNSSSFWNTLSRAETATQRNFNQLETLIVCCKKGVVEDLKQCLAREVHKKDNRGTALYWALCYGHEDCVRELIAVDVPVQPKHYYAAALIPEDKNEKTNAVDLYKLIRKSSGARTTDYPSMILEGNLDEIQQVLPDLDQEKASAYLYKLLSLDHINCVRSILEQSNVSLEPRHYFAAAQDKDHISAKKIYDYLAFYQIKSANLHAIHAEDILGVHANAPDWVIKKTYKALLLEFHPDKNPNDTKRAEEAAKKINTAKEKLFEHKGRDSAREEFFTTNFPQFASVAFNI